jgi:hypothetical protein
MDFDFYVRVQTIRYTQMMRKLFLLRDIAPSTELRPTNFANKLDLKKSFETAVIWKKELSKDIAHDSTRCQR